MTEAGYGEPITKFGNTEESLRTQALFALKTYSVQTQLDAYTDLYCEVCDIMGADYTSSVKTNQQSVASSCI